MINWRLMHLQSFILGFHHPQSALHFSCQAQCALLELAWPTELLRHRDAASVWMYDQVGRAGRDVWTAENQGKQWLPKQL